MGMQNEHEHCAFLSISSVYLTMFHWEDRGNLCVTHTAEIREDENQYNMAFEVAI